MISRQLLLLIIAFHLQPVAADGRCDCTRFTGNCSATIKRDAGPYRPSNWYVIETNVDECVRVDHVINGVQLLSIFRYGGTSEEWLGVKPIRETSIESCKVCAYTQAHQRRLSMDRSQPVISDIDGGYPVELFDRGIQGRITVEFWVDEDGTASDFEVITATPKGAFEETVLNNLQRATFLPARKNNQPVRAKLKQTFIFGTVGDGIPKQSFDPPRLPYEPYPTCSSLQMQLDLLWEQNNVRGEEALWSREANCRYLPWAISEFELKLWIHDQCPDSVGHTYTEPDSYVEGLHENLERFYRDIRDC